MYFQRILIYCLSFVAIGASANNLSLKKEIKEPKVKVETVRMLQPKRPTASADNSFMPVFLTTSNVKANDFTQEMLKSLATSNYIKPSVKLSTIKASNVASNKQSIRQSAGNKENKKMDMAVKSETVVTRWSKAGSTSNFSPVLPINLSKMHFDTTGFIPIVPKQSTGSSNPKLVKLSNKPISRPLVNARTIPLPKHQQPVVKNASKHKTQNNGNNKLLMISKDAANMPNPSVRASKQMKALIKPITKPSTSSALKPVSAPKLIAPKSITFKSTTNAKIVDNRPISAASSTELNSYLNSQLNSREARKALLKMNTLRYLAKLSPQWAASSLSESYQPSGSLKAYPIGKITVPEQGSYEGGAHKKKPEISIELIKEILHKLTHDEVQFNKLYVMGTHRPKGQNDMNNDQQYGQPNNEENGNYNQENNDENANGYQAEQVGYAQPENGGSYQQDKNSNGHQSEQSGYIQPENGYNLQDQGGYNQQDGGYSQPDYSQGDQGGNSYDSGSSYSNGGDSYSNESGNSYNSNEGGNSYDSNEGSSYNTQPDNENSYHNGASVDERDYHLQSLGYDMSQYTNRAYVPAYSLNSLASFVHSRFKDIAMRKHMGEYQFTDNPYLNSYDNYKSMDVNYGQFVQNNNNNNMGGVRKKCSKHRTNNNQNEGNYANNDVNFDDSYNNYVIKLVPGMNMGLKAK